MAQLTKFCYGKVLLLSVLLFLSASVCFSACSQPQLHTTHLSTTRRLLDTKNEGQQEKPLKKKTSTTIQSTKNQTKLIKPNNPSSKNNQTKTIKSDNISSKNQTKSIKSNNISSKNQTKAIKPHTATSSKTIKSNNLSSKNQTKPTKLNSNSPSKTTPTDTKLKKLNSTVTTPKKTKKLNTTSKPSPVPIPSKKSKSLDLTKPSNKTTKATVTTKTKTSKVDHTQTQESNKKQKTTSNQQQSKKPTKQTPPSRIMDEEEEEDLVSEFTDLPNKFHRTLIPDLERISTTSKAYITIANNEITKGFKPYVGKKYASTVATIVSCAFVLIPLLLVSLLCTKIKTYFSLQKILIVVQVYLSIHFTILCVSSLVTGLEPLKFLYSTSRSTYLCLQVLQTLAYLLYLLLLLMYLVLVFSTEFGLGSKVLGLAQIFVGFAVGLHYYVTVFHRVVRQQPPKTNWKIHGIYATCFLVICVLAKADSRKKTYVEDGGGEGKRN